MVDLPLPSAADIAALERANQRLKAADLELEAWKVAQLAIMSMPKGPNGMSIFPGTPQAHEAQVAQARALLAESRRQVAAERGSA